MLKPSYAENKKAMSHKTGAFNKVLNPKYIFEVNEVSQNGGQAPCPRFLHSACMVLNRYLAIYGGRND